MSKFRVVIYCPDTHIPYDRDVPDRRGVGGGLLARLRLAQALARLGHQVTVIGNANRQYWQGNVKFVPLKQMPDRIEADILVAGSSGGELSLLPLLAAQRQVRWLNIWIQGDVWIQGVDRLEYNHIISCSNFIHRTIRETWPLSSLRCFTIYNGATTVLKKWFGRLQRRNPYRLIYTSHPYKGLRAALAVLQKVRARDPRYHLWIFGGDRMYGGQSEQAGEAIPGVTWFGTRGHREVLSALMTASVSLVLQARPEPFGMVLTEAMLHGAIPIASAVGAYPELISHGENGILISEEHLSEEALTLAAEWIWQLQENPDLALYLRRHAMQIPWDWDTMARVWTGYWEWFLQGKGTLLPDRQRCDRCEGRLLVLPDGYHCVQCGWYYYRLMLL